MGTQKGGTKARDALRIPYETGIDSWRSITQSYGHAVLLAVANNERSRWTTHPFLSRFRVFSCGYYEEARGHDWERKRLAEGVLIYCTAGKGYYAYRGVTYPVSSGDVLYCFPNTHHRYYADASDPWTIYWMHVSGESVSYYEYLMGVKKRAPVISVGLREDIVHLFRALLKGYESVPDERQWLRSTSCAEHILACIAASPKLKPPMKVHSSTVESLIKNMRESVGTTVSLDEMAAQVDMSPSHLCKVFRAFTGHTPLQYFNRLKIQRACSLLATSRLTIAQIAIRLGFDDPYYFSRLFRNTMKVAPKHYREQNFAPFTRAH